LFKTWPLFQVVQSPTNIGHINDFQPIVGRQLNYQPSGGQ